MTRNGQWTDLVWNVLQPVGEAVVQPAKGADPWSKRFKNQNDPSLQAPSVPTK